jgi:type II secretory pathway predicted ATPase ExeA
MPEQDNHGRMAQMEALRRLWEIANGHSGQCLVVAGFLLGLFNGEE